MAKKEPVKPVAKAKAAVKTATVKVTRVRKPKAKPTPDPVVEVVEEPRVWTQDELVDEAENGTIVFHIEARPHGARFHVWHTNPTGRGFMLAIGKPHRADTARSIGADLFEHGRKSEHAELVDL